MKKRILFSAVFLAATVLGSTIASAQEKEKVVTGTISYLSPSTVQVLDEYIANQLYSGEGVSLGLNVKLGALYKKHDNLSWDVYYTSYDRPSLLDKPEAWPTLTNPANTQNMNYSAYNFGYGTYYHWQFGKKLKIKTGGMFDLYGAYKESIPDGVNNFMNLEGQIMLKAHAAIKYGWDFKKWGLDLHGCVSLPLIGIITADHPSEPAVSILGANDHSIMNPVFRHIFLGAYHNYMSLDYELGIDFVFKPCTLTFGFGSTYKWWNVYDVQNIRKINYTTIGFAFDIVSRNKFKSSNKNF